MSFKTDNELATFGFGESTLSKIKLSGDNLILEVLDVIIKEMNPCNTACKDMATNELTLEIRNIDSFDIIQDGYIIRDMDGKIREDVKDRDLSEDEKKELINSIEGFPLAGIEKKENFYYIYIDTEESLISYTAKISAKCDIEEWERFRNLPDTYR